MALIILLCVFSSRALPSSGISLKTNYTDSLKFQGLKSKVSKEVSFLTLYNLAVKDCVYECQVRSACEAVNYWRASKKCELLEVDLDRLSPSPAKQQCVYIRKRSVREPADINLTTLCPDAPCALSESCDVEKSKCRITECRRHNHVVHGNILSVGSKILAMCDRWFVPESGDYVSKICIPNGTWFNLTPCIFQFACGIPLEFPNANAHKWIVEDEQQPKSRSVLYQCEEGYAAPLANNDMTILCHKHSVGNGTYTVTWGAPQFKCVRNCSEPPEMANATVAGNDTLEGSVRIYTCIAGLVGNNIGFMTTTCQPNGTWTTVDFQCLPVCEVPPIIPNAIFSNITSTDNVSSVMIDCKSGYSFCTTGTRTLTCRPPGPWSRPTDTCLKDCSEPPVLENATMSAGDTLEGTTRNYTCIPGHYVNGTELMTVTCQSDGTWTALEFQCIQKAISNAFLSAVGTHAGETRIYLCSPSYVLRNVDTLDTTCQSDGTWSAPSFNCLRDCGTPPAIQNAKVSVGGTNAGETRSYSCSLGYVVRNVVTVDTTCQSDGTWSTSSFDCLWDCGNPPPLPFSTFSVGDTVQDSTMAYPCDYGYGTTGTSTITCLDGTGWSAPTSTCAELVCDSGWQKIELSCYYTPGSGSGFESDVFTARDLCHTYDAYLVQLETESESNAVESWFYGLYPGIPVWIGLSDDAVEGTWVWMNSSVPATWTDWNSDQPNGGDSQNYCVLWDDGTWEDKSWNHPRQPLCEKSPVPS